MICIVYFPIQNTNVRFMLSELVLSTTDYRSIEKSVIDDLRKKIYETTGIPFDNQVLEIQPSEGANLISWKAICRTPNYRAPRKKSKPFGCKPVSYTE